MKLDFYNVNKEYIEFLQNAEIKKRGFTRVPNMNYKGRKQKFICGILLDAPRTQLKYFAGVTHYKVQRSENFLIRVENDREPIKGALRFNYMFPVPLQLVSKINILKEPDVNYKILMSKELKAINNNAQLITSKARDVYNKIVNGRCSANLKTNSCDFTYLEEKCMEYCKLKGIDISPAGGERENAEKMEPERTPFNDLLIKLSKSNKNKEKNNDPER
jgi:protein AbiQ